MRRAALLLLVLLPALAASALLGGGGGVSAAPTAVWPECTPAPSNCDGWYRGPVSLAWHHPGARATNGCDTRALEVDTPGTRFTCTAWEGSPDSGTSVASVVIRIDATPPTLTAAVPDRPPDHGTWFNHPVGLGFRASDATSGVVSCSTSSYGGPDGAGVQIAGTCRDAAGNVGARAFPIDYDATAPPPPSAAAMPGDGLVKLDWSLPPEAELVEVARVSGPSAAGVVFRGRAEGFTDRSLRNHARYRYAVTTIDRAGNRAQAGVSAVPTDSRLLLPARGARVGAPPLLVWKGARRAAYYNVQLLRGRRKVLSRWPRAARLQLDARWRFGGRPRRLAPGLYRWYVWPGRGERSKRRYGKLLGASSFRVRR